MPTLPAAQAAELRERLRGLTPAQADQMKQLMRLHAAGDKMLAYQWLLQTAREAPDHPEVQLWQGLRLLEAQEWQAAALQLGAAAAQRPGDLRLHCLLAKAQDQGGDSAAARASLQRAAGCARSAADWLKLSIECDQLGFYEEALQAADALQALEPLSPAGLLQRARCSKALGQGEAAAADCRRLIAAGREPARAWFALTDLKTQRLDAAELAQLERAAARRDGGTVDRYLLDFALGKALEDAGRSADALQAIERANAGVRAAGAVWDANGFARLQTGLRDVFEAGCAQADPQGGEVIFVVGLPRSGSTLTEQVLAAHSEVEGASELPYLAQVIEAESRRRGRPYPSWVAQASAADWTRLGQDYLRLSARWRLAKPRFTDKMPDNWLYLGAIRAMLPQARVIDCRRDLLETCWSCYKQLFGPGRCGYSYEIDSLAGYAQACVSEGDRWAARDPARIRVQHYEALVAEPEAQIRALLDFCGLPFEAACLAFQGARRAIRTPSALQVRQPMREASTPAARMGELLAPLRDALAKKKA